MTRLWEHLTPAVRSLTGTNELRLMPSDPMVKTTASGTVQRAAMGWGLVFTYAWQHEQDGPQEGALLVSSADEDGIVRASWVDSWHQKPAPLSLKGEARPDGCFLEGTYYEVWGWQIEVHLGDEVRVDMRNVIPAQAIPGDMAGSVDPGPYDVVHLRLS